MGHPAIRIRSTRSWPIASTHALQPQGVAWNAIARNAIMADPDWQGGHYYGTGRAPDAGMGVARMVGHITYLSAQSLGDKFGRRLQFADDIRYTLTEPEFEVESYLRHQADTFVRRFDANTYLYTSRALTYFDLARQYGGGELDATRCARVSARTLLIAFSSDWLYPPSGSEELARRAARARQGCRAARDRRAVRPRLLPAGGGAADADDPAVSSRASRTTSESRHGATGRIPRVRIRHPSGARRASARIRTPARAPCRSSRRRATCSRIRSRPRRTSTCRNTGTPTRGS